MFPSKGNKLLCPYLWKEIQSPSNFASCKDVPRTKKESSRVKRNHLASWIFLLPATSFPYHTLARVTHLPKRSQFLSPFETVTNTLSSLSVHLSAILKDKAQLSCGISAQFINQTSGEWRHGLESAGSGTESSASSTPAFGRKVQSC